ncbi:MAG: ComEA family DNA-binding protein [Clostridia bacterium]|nr:ComEA family DNA-binding protein [Clostridia bacterium]
MRNNRNVISTVMMSLVLLVSAASLVVGIINYNRFNDIQLNAQFYIQNGDETVNPQMNEVLSGYVLYEPETTTVPHIEIVTETTTVNGETTTAVQTTAAVTTTQQATQQIVTTQKPVSQADKRININTATVEELTALSGVGEKKAQAIVDYRNENGYFTSVEELTNVSGIGEKTLEKNIDIITVG